jgi:hypothetical protein
MAKHSTEASLAQAFADEYRHVLSWRKKHQQPGQSSSWYYEGHWDEYAIEARKLALNWLARTARKTLEPVGTEASNERAFRLLELAKEKLKDG